ncbi:Transmembrane protein 14C [Collichthys lucidus]|uniref:Transmembrane protein 14C n=1 Tax=Collichthys lucidus TaxID=240159 RepID=A0A4U5UW87_COLLU|nr:Transmembrane protein 14C [Collichthys lucidus]
MFVDWVGFSYAALVSAGGIMGYLKAGSSTSLVAGLLFGLLAAVGAYLASQNPKNVWLSLVRQFYRSFYKHMATTVSPLLRKCRHLRNAGCGDGTEVSQLVEVHASWFNDFSECASADEDPHWDAEETT